MRSIPTRPSGAITNPLVDTSARSGVIEGNRVSAGRHGPEPAPSQGFRASPALAPDDRDPAIARAVARAQAGDMEAIRFLYLRYRNNIYGYVLSMLRDPHDAEDVTQHVFLKLISAIGRYQAREVPFTSWILRVARNAAVDHLRQRRAVPCEEVFGPTRRFDDAGRDRRWGLEQALLALSEDERGVVMMRHLVGLSPSEIADRMGRSEASIHGLHHRARRVLKRELANIECAPTAKAA
jgi:RNA polymerase sigma-70 factor (ECF subfamily)